MALFKLNDSVKQFTFRNITFNVFRNTWQLFEAYNKQQENFMFMNCFEYVNKNNLNAKYDVLYLVNEDKIYLYIYHRQKEYIISYNYESYQYLLDTYDIDTEIKFMSEDEINSLSNECKTGIEIVDAIYYVDALCTMPGKKYIHLRQRRNNFVNHNPNTVFRKYTDSDKIKIRNLYNIWKNDKKENDMICDAKVFASGLDSEYLEKFVLTDSKNNVIGFASFYDVGEWLYMYSMKTMRDRKTLRNTNVYLVHCLWNYIKENYPNVKYINLGGMDNPGWVDDFKEQLKPDIYLKNYINVKVKEVKK